VSQPTMGMPSSCVVDDLEVGTSHVLHVSKFKTTISCVNHLILIFKQFFFRNINYVSTCIYGYVQISNVL
jgi:hypothetical protein